MAPERAASVTRARPRLPRPPPRPRSAPPSKVIKSRFADSSAIDIFRMDAGPPPETFDDVEKLRKAEWTDEVIQREQATDVLSQGRWYRVPEKLGLPPERPDRPGGILWQWENLEEEQLWKMAVPLFWVWMAVPLVGGAGLFAFAVLYDGEWEDEKYRME